MYVCMYGALASALDNAGRVNFTLDSTEEYLRFMVNANISFHHSMREFMQSNLFSNDIKYVFENDQKGNYITRRIFP